MDSTNTARTCRMSKDIKERIQEILKELGGWEGMWGTCHPRFMQPGGWRDGPYIELKSVAAENIPNWAMRYVAVMMISLDVVLKITGFSERKLRRLIADGLFPAPSQHFEESEYWSRVEVRAWFDTMLLVASHIESDTPMSRDLVNESYHTHNGSRIVVVKGGRM